MITAIFAKGVSDEFGCEGGLPWGSFPQELEAYHSALEESFAQPGMPIILVGAKTWLGLPDSAIQKLVSYTSNIWIYGSRNTLLDMRNTTANFTFISNIGNTLPPEWSYSNIVCIGGATVLEQLFNRYHVDRAYISTISNSQAMEMPNDTKIKIPEYINDTTRIIKMTGKKDRLSFVQELYIL